MDRSYSRSKYMRKLKYSNKKKNGYKYINYVDKKITHHIKEKYVGYTPLAIRANFNHDECELLVINNHHKNIEILDINDNINEYIKRGRKLIKRRKKAKYSRNDSKNDKFKNIKSKTISNESFHPYWVVRNVRRQINSKLKRKSNNPNPSRFQFMSSLHSIRKQFQQHPDALRTKTNQLRPSTPPPKPLKNMGYALSSNEYPSKSTKQRQSQRLMDILGDPYQNILWSTKNKDNNWSAHKLLNSTINSNMSKTKMVNRGLALNEKTGDIAMMTMTHIYIFKSNKSSNESTLISLHKFTSDQVLQNEDKQLSRIRFINNQLYVFSYTRATIFVFEITHENKIEITRNLQETYFSEARVVDIVVTDELLIILFSKWLGIYKLHPTLEWYHAVAYSRQDHEGYYQIEMTVFEDAEDQNCMENEAYFADCKQVQKEQVVDEYYKETNKNYMILSVRDELIGIHPVNPTFEMLHVASDVQYNDKFCSSKFYGVFYTKHNGKMLYQSPYMECDSCQEILNLNDGVFGVAKIYNIVYDELYGISGRLLLFCESVDGEMIMHQIVNYDELVHFSGILGVVDIDFYGVPGVLMVYVYQMLYGDALIAKLVQGKHKGRTSSDICVFSGGPMEEKNFVNRCMIRGNDANGTVIDEECNDDDGNKINVTDLDSTEFGFGDYGVSLDQDGLKRNWYEKRLKYREKNKRLKNNKRNKSKKTKKRNDIISNRRSMRKLINNYCELDKDEFIGIIRST